MASSVQIPVTQTGLEASIQAALRNAGKNAQINLGTNSRQVNALAQPLGRITGQADEFTKSMEAANARVFAFGASVGIINSVSKAFGALVKNTIAVEKSLVEINSVLGESSSEIDKFGGKLFEVAKNTGQSFEAVSKGALELARQGLSTEETLKRINDALILTRLSGLDAGKSVDGLTAAVNSFKSTGITTSEVLNKLVNVSQKYAVSEKDLIEGLKRSSSVAKQAGVSLDELVGVITAVQEKSAVGGAVIGTSFKTIFSRLQKKDTLVALQQLGIEVTDVQGKILPATRLLENLAVKIKSLDQLQIAQITEKVGGGYQIDKLISALDDMGSKGSVAFKATKLSAESANQAYEKNAALNKTLANLINETTLSAQELGATLGKLGITDNAKNLLGFFNSVLESIQKILGEESTLGNVFRGLAKGIGNLVSGPGLALFGAIILKLSKDLAQFGFASLKSFFGIGKAAKEVQTLEKSIAQALASNVKLQQQLFSLEGNRAAQIKVMTDAIIQQEAAMRRMASTSSSLAGPLYQQGVRGTSSGLRVPKAAGGYMPAVAQEASDINRGVGGAKSGDRPVVIPNFNFGGGKKGSIVAHTGEYAVPNFNGSGGTAIFNRDMVRSMGLPSGAKKISAAGGLIPNFARKTLNFNEKGKLSSGDEYLLDNEYYSGVADVGLDSLSKNAVNYRKTVFKLRGESLNSATNRIIDKGSADTIKKALGDAVGSTDVDLWLENRKIAKGQVKPLSKGSTKKTVDFKKQRTGLFSAVKGALFESYLKKNRNDIISFGEGSTQPLDFDFKEKTNSLGIEAKSGDFSTHQLIAKAIRAKYGSKYKNKKENTIGKIGTVDLFVPSAASGFIPNFAAKPNASVDTIRAAVAEGIEAYRRPGLNEYGQPFKTYWFPDGSQASQGQVEKALKQNPSIASTKKKEDAEKRQKKMDEKGVMDFVIDANTLGGIALVTPARGGSSGTLSAQSLMQNLPKKPEGFLMDDKLIIENIQSTGVPTQKNFEQISSEINKRFAGPIVDLAQSLYGKLYSGVSGSDFASKLGQLRSTSKGGILPPGAEGQIFEAAGKAALTSMSQIASAFDPSKENRPFDFTNAASMKEMLGVTAVRGDAKRAGGSKRQFQETVNGLLKKSINDDILKPKIFSQIKQQAKGRKLPENLPENAAAGFIPNFVSKTREIGAGAEGRFLRLGKKDGLDVGVKKFGKDVSNTEVGKEWLLGQYINRYLGVSGVTGPKIMSTLDSSMKNRRIRKEIVSGDLGKTALGMEKSYRFGLGTLRSAIKAKGLDLTDLHGGNYIINNNAKKYISGLSSYPTDPISSTQLLKEMASKGGFASVIDPGFGKLTGSPARQIVDKMITHLENLKTNAARGFLPNFAQKSFRMEDDYGWSYRQYRTKNGSALDFERDIDYERDQEYLKLTGVKSEKKGDAYKLFLQLAKLAKRTKMPIYSDELISQAERKLRGAKEPVDFDQMSNWDELMYKFPQLRYRQIPRLKTSGSFGSISFKTLDGLKKLVTKMPKKEFQSQMSFGIGELISKYASRGFLPNFADPLKEAVGREMAAGVPASQIYIDKNQSLKSAANPMGLMVANRRDEPAGGHQGISRAIREGRNPKTYGASRGFVPNYAEPTVSQSGDSSKLMSSLFMFQVAVSTASGFLDQFGDTGKRASEALQSMATTALIFGGIAISGPVKRLKELSDTVFKLNKQVNTTVKKGGVFSGLRQGFNKGLSGEGYEFVRPIRTDRARNRLSNKYDLSNVGLGTARFGAVAGGLTRGVGALVGGIAGPALLAVGAFKMAADAAKAFTTFSNESAKSLANISVYASKASASLSELDKAAIESESKRSYGMTIDTFMGALRNISGVNAMASAVSGMSLGDLNYKGRNIQTADVSEEQFKQTEQAFITSYVAANRTKFANAKDAAGAASMEFDKFIKNQLDYVSTYSLDTLESQIKTFSDEALKMQKENALAEALLEARVQSEIAERDIINFNKVLGDTKKRFTEIKKQVFNFDNIISAFKAVGETSVDNAYNFSEYDKSIAKLQLSLNGLDASGATKQLNLVAQTQEKLYSITKETIGGREKLEEKNKERFEEIVSKITSGQKLNLDPKKDTDLIGIFGSDYKKVLEGISEEFSIQTLELENQTTVEKQNLQIETYRSLIAQETTSRIEAQNKQLELSASNSQKILEYSEKIRESRNKISDVKFERSLIGATESQRLRAEMGRNSLLRSRISEESLIGFRQDRTQSIESLSGMIPSTMSAQSQFDLKSQIQEAIRDIRQQPNLDAVSQVASKKYEEIFNKISETTKKESENRSKQADELRNAILGSSTSFTDSVVEAGKKFAEIVSEGKNLPEKLKMETEIADDKNKLEKLKQRKNSLELQYDISEEERKNKLKSLEKEMQDLSTKILESVVNLNLKFPSPSLNSKKTTAPVETGATLPQNAPQTNISPLSDADIALEAAKQAEAAAAEDLGLSYDRNADSLDKLENIQRMLADKFSQLVQSVPANIADLQFSQMTSISGKEIAQSKYDEETQNQIKAAADAGKSNEDIAKIIRDRQNKPLTQLLSEAFSTTEQERSMNLKNSIVEASVQFKNNMIDGISEAIEGGKSLGDILRGSAYEFVKMINKQLMNNLVDSVIGGSEESSDGGGIGGFFKNFFASGGKVNGGSGSKDDVPAMLMGGEYVINKKAVQKYGPQFLEAINNGTIGGYAAGGQVLPMQTGKGGFFTPGTYGLGAIEGKRNLLDFATQAYTSGEKDQIISGDNFASISLEPESVRLTNFGRMNSPQAEATRAAKEQAFGVYVQEVQAEAERAREKKEEKKAFKRQLIMAAAMAVASPIVKAGKAGFMNALKNSGGNLGEAFKGIWSGGNIGGGNFGGLKNLFSGNFEASQIGSKKDLFNSLLEKEGIDPETLAEGMSYRNQLIGNSSSYNPTGTGPFDSQGNYIDAWADDPSKWPKVKRRATGGSIPSMSGIDTVPAMLSGGEFIMNRSAAQNIGAGNLQALNAGAGSIVTEEKTEELNDKLIAKLDELIEASGAAGSITINVEGSTGNSQETSNGQNSEQKQQLARQIRDAVLKVIQEEKRLGGSLRR